MPQELLSMRKITEVLRLKHVQKLSNRKIRLILQDWPSHGRQLPQKGRRCRPWPLPDGMTETELQARLFPRPKLRRHPSCPQILTGTSCTRNSRRKASICFCSGRRTKTPTRTATSTAGSAASIATGGVSWIWSCGRPTEPGREALCRLRRKYHPHRGLCYRRGHIRRDLHRRPGRKQLHLCRSYLDPEPA